MDVKQKKPTEPLILTVLLQEEAANIELPESLKNINFIKKAIENVREKQ